MNEITVLLADEHDLVRRQVRRILEGEAGIKVVGEAQTGLEAVALAQELRPAIVLMDVAMPELNGLQAARQILEIIPTTKVVLLTGHTEPAYVEEAINLGARGYLIKQTAFDTLGDAIYQVHQGKPVFTLTIPQLYEGAIRSRPAPT